MEYIHRLPFILGAIMAIIVGIISLEYNASQQIIYIRMLIGMVVFFAVGLYLRTTLLKVMDEVEAKKKEQEELEYLESVEKQSEEKGNALHENPAANGYGEDFSPLRVSEVINTRTDS